MEVDGERDGLLDGVGDTEAEGEDDGELDTEAEGDAEGDADGDALGETTPAGTIDADLPRHIPEGNAVSSRPSKAHLSVDCSHRQIHTDRTRG